jgi:hypothetical protein
LDDNGGGNLGDPAIKNIAVRDTSDWNSYRVNTKSCQSCGELLGNAAVRIEDGVITKAWLYAPSEFNDEWDHYLIEQDGTLEPIVGWEDHPMGVIKGC